MSTSKTPSVYIVPVNPSGSTPSAVEGIDPSKLWSTLPASQGSKPAKAGTTHLLFNTPSDKLSALASLGPAFAKAHTPAEARREAVRTAVGAAVQNVKGLGDAVHGSTVAVDVSATGEYTQAASEAAHLALYSFTLKTDPPSPFNPALLVTPEDKLSFTPISRTTSEELKKAWQDGKVYAEAQNLARTLMELPANMLTPTLFTERVQKETHGLKGVRVIVRDRGTLLHCILSSLLSIPMLC